VNGVWGAAGGNGTAHGRRRLERGEDEGEVSVFATGGGGA
jgi:hypothetical protein